MKNTIVFILVIIVSSCETPIELTKCDSISHPYKFSQEIEQDLETNTEPWKYQLAAWQYSYIGQYDEVLKAWDNGRAGKRDIDQELFDDFNKSYNRHDAVDYIASQADTAQVIIINEAHHQPLHRVFTTELLEDLYEKGYRYFGLETLNDIDTEINDRKYPIYSSGTYSKEPQFGNLMRSALDIGYVLFAYESDAGSGKEREIGQARNIEEQIKKDSTAKYLIHCGFAHATEGVYPSWEKAMAGRLQEFTGINPLTINQTEFTEKSVARLDHPIFQQLNLSESSVFVDHQGSSYKHENPEWFDIMVFHPRTELKSSRPNWVFRNDRKQVEINVKDVDLQRPFLVLAIKENEDIQRSVPCDVVEVEIDDEIVTLALESGSYNIIFQNLSSEALLRKTIVE